MKAAVLYESGGPDALKFAEVPEPICGADDVLIRVGAISIEGGDLLARTRELPSSPHVIGYSAAGTIVKVGSAVRGFQVGEAVSTFGFSGSHAELRAVNQHCCWPIPEGLDFAVAAAVPIAFGTAHECLFEYGRVRKGETVLIQGAAGAVGLAAIQLAKRAGATVLASGSSDSRLGPLRDYGADVLINHRSSDLEECVLAITNGKGADLVIDPVGGSLLQKGLDSLGIKGRLLTVGRAAREPMVVDISSMVIKQKSIIGIFLGAEMTLPRVNRMMTDLLRDVARGELKMVIGRRFPISQAAEAHAFAESPERDLGRVVLIP